jgi:hypothetical protein
MSSRERKEPIIERDEVAIAAFSARETARQLAAMFDETLRRHRK